MMPTTLLNVSAQCSHTHTTEPLEPEGLASAHPPQGADLALCLMGLQTSRWGQVSRTIRPPQGPRGFSTGPLRSQGSTRGEIGIFICEAKLSLGFGKTNSPIPLPF